jgi:hypothetical protein
MASRGGVLTGSESFFLRDLGTTHRPASILFSELRFARTNPYASFGQPYLGNPNLLVAYPFPKGSTAVNLQIVVHLCLAFAGMFALLRRMSASGEGAFLAAAAFTLSGYVLSATASLNAITTIGWIPWLLWCATAITSPLRAAVAIAVISIASVAGEPLLFALAMLLAASLALVSGGPRALAWFACCALAAALLTVPLHLETLAAASESARVQLGFTFQNASSASLHPARLFEIVIPFFFGNPSRLVAGGWWGYAVSGGLPAYVASTSFGILPLALALSCAMSTRFRHERFWWAVAAITLLLSFGGYLPGAEWMYEMVSPLHSARFPIKLYLFTTLALAVIAGRAFDHLAAAPDRVRRNVVRVLATGAFLALTVAIVARLNEGRLGAALITRWWDPRWRSSPEEVVGPIVAGIPGRLVVVALILFALLFWAGRRRGAAGHLFLLTVVIAELIAGAGPLLPTVPASTYRRPSAIVTRAREMHGRIFERTEKDLDPIVFGLKGRYPSDDVRQLAVVQARQAWSLTGAAFGIRYAYDPSPDGSYTARNQRIEDLLARADWPRRLKWLRAAGVAGVISSTVPEGTPGLAIVYKEPPTESGIPTTLYAVSDRLPEARRAGRVRVARTVTDAVEAFERPDFDPRQEVVVESPSPLPLSGGSGSARIVREEPDRIEAETSGDSRTILFLARSYSRRLRASVNGTPARIFPANVHLIGVQVPAGYARVEVKVVGR